MALTMNRGISYNDNHHQLTGLTINFDKKEAKNVCMDTKKGNKVN